MIQSDANNRFNIAKTSIILSAISLLADTVALAQLTFNIIQSKQPQNYILQIIAVVLVFLFGLGVGSLAVRGGEEEPVRKVYGVFMWVYLVMACLTYLGITLQFRRAYILDEYIAFIIVIILQIAAFLVLRQYTHIESVAYALAPLTVGLIHALIFLFYLVFVGTTPLFYIIGEWLFWAGWLLFGALLLRSFRSDRAGNLNPFSSKFRRRD